MNASKVGLKINFKKTKILHAGHNSQPCPVTTINGYTLEICNDFLYLGVSTKTPLNVVQEKIGRAWFASGKLRPIFISKISNAYKMSLFKATVETIAAYGLESVPMTRSLCRQIDASHRQLVRAALGITWPDCRTYSAGQVNSFESYDPQASTLSCWPHDWNAIKVSNTTRHITNNCTFELPPPARSWSNFNAST